MLDEPLVSLKSENQPWAVLFDPVVLKLSALTFSAALLPLPRSSGRGGFAWATGESAKQASSRMIVVSILFRFFVNYFSFHKGSNEVAEPGSEIFFGKVARGPSNARRARRALATGLSRGWAFTLVEERKNRQSFLDELASGGEGSGRTARIRYNAVELDPVGGRLGYERAKCA